MAVMEAEVPTTNGCQATKSDGTNCRANATSDGYCYFHSPATKTERLQRARKGGQKSASEQRARRETEKRALQELMRDARGMLREHFATDEAWQKALVAAYRDPVMMGDEKTRMAAASEFINQTQGKPQQNIQSKHEHTITVVSRLDSALERPRADLELPASEVIEATD